MLTNTSIKLRNFETEDIEKLSTIRSSSKSYDYFYEFEPLNKTQQLNWWQNSYLKSSEKNFVIVCNDTQKVAGTISLVDIDQRNRKAELGRLFVFEEFSGKGFGSFSIELLIEYAFNHLNLQKIYLEVFAKNENAVSLYKKAGFKEEGCLKSHIYKNGEYLDILIMSLFKGKK